MIINIYRNPNTSPGLNLDSPVQRQELKSQLFLKSQKSSAHASGAWRNSHPLVLIPIWDFYFDISEWYILSAWGWTPALMLHLTNPCTKRKVLILTKPKGKIYETKSLRHYISVYEQPVVSWGQILRIGWVQKQFEVQFMKFCPCCKRLVTVHIVVKEHFFLLHLWWYFWRILPLNALIMQYNIRYWWLFLFLR